MPGLFECGAVTITSFTATSSFILAGYARSPPCRAGCFKGCFGFHSKSKLHQHIEHVEKTLPKEHLGSLKKEGVPVRVDGSFVGERDIEFNGEILFMKDATDDSKIPYMALGASNVTVEECQVILEPPAVPSLDLTFSDSQEAQRWARQFQEAVRRGPPQERIFEFIEHALKIQKHVGDLHRRVSRVSEVEKQNSHLKKQIKILKAFGAHNQEHEKPSTKVKLVTSWFNARGAAKEEGDANPEIKKKWQTLSHKMVSQYNREGAASEESEESEAAVDEIVDEGVSSVEAPNDVDSLEPSTAERFVLVDNAQRNESPMISFASAQQSRSESKSNQLTSRSECESRAKSVVAASVMKAVASAETMPDRAYKESQSEPLEMCAAIIDQNSESKRSTPEALVAPSTQPIRQPKVNTERDFERLLRDMESRLHRQFDADGAGVRLQLSPLADKNSSDKFPNVDSIMKIQQPPELCDANPAHSFRSLQDRIQSHELQFHRDCEMMQQVLRIQVA